MGRGARLRKPPELVGLVKSYGLSGSEFGNLVGVCKTTGCRLLAVPEKLDVEQLRKLVKAGMDIEDLASAVFGVRLRRKL